MFLRKKITDFGGVLIATQRISILANRYLNNQNSSTNVQTIRSLQQAIVAYEKVLKYFVLPYLVDIEVFELLGISECVVEFGRLLDDVTKTLMHLSLRGIQYSLNSDLNFLEKKDSLHISEINSSELEDEVIMNFKSRIDELNQILGD